jgi:predicted TIM-barrel fold metal-dependent hydrolase
MKSYGISWILGVLILGIAPMVAQERLPIIDMHLHAYGVFRDQTGQPMPRYCKPEPCEHIPAVAKEDSDVLRLTLEAMDRNNIVLGFLSARSDSAVEKWVTAAPERFIPAAELYAPKGVKLSELHTLFETRKYRGIGELLNQYLAIPANDPRMDSIFALAVEFDLPVLIHSGGTGATGSKFRIASGHPELLEEVLLKYPTLRLCIAHAGFPFFEEIVTILYRYPNVYVDVSAINWIIPRPMFYRYLRGLIDAGLSKRIMFGTDQMAWSETIDIAIEAIESAEFLTPEQKRDIFYNNAARFLRLQDKAKSAK